MCKTIIDNYNSKKHTRGFITIATGHEKYFHLALNLLRSYRACAINPLPFAILTDKENEYTKEFDDVFLLGSLATGSYMDKLYLAEYVPYDETIFVDADSLCLSDPNEVFEDFQECGDVSFYGWITPLDSPSGWFNYAKCHEYKDKIQYHIGGHGGLCYFRRTEKCKEIMSLARKISGEYDKYDFSYFSKPADEPVIALAMAVTGCIPCQKPKKMIFWPRYRGRLKIDYRGTIKIDRKEAQIVFLHFGTPYTSRFFYKWLQELIENNYYVENPSIGKKRYLELRIRMLPNSIKKGFTHQCFLFLRKVNPKFIKNKD